MSVLYPKHLIRKVTYTRTEIQVIDTRGQQMRYVDPEGGKGDIVHRSALPEKVTIVDKPRRLTESEAALANVPYERDPTEPVGAPEPGGSSEF